MTEPHWLDEDEQVAWHNLVRLTRRVYSALARDLKESSGLSAADFEVLVALSDQADPRSRVMDIAKELEWEKGRLSHHLKRMEERGLVARTGCSNDRRVTYVSLTDQGQKSLELAAPRHVTAVRTLVIDPLAPAQLELLAAMATRLLSASESSESSES